MGDQAEQYAEVIEVSPSMAKAWLKKMAPNRSISRKRVKHLANLMKMERFKLNGETIKFDEEGWLIDGQHRLAAIVFADIPVVMYVAHNVPRSAIVSIDMGRSRSLTDQLRVAYNYRNPGDLGTIVRMILEWNETGWISQKSFRQVDPDEVHDYIRSNPDVIELPRVATGLGGDLVTAIMKRNQCGFLMWLLSRVDADDAKRFMNNLVNSVADYENDPCVLLRKHLLKLRNDRYGDVKRNIVLGLTIQNWNKWRDRQPVKLIRVPRSGQPWDVSSFPKPI
ncbi:hypothetical protein SAMN05192558_109293 [Actinokineospora alba]|uniref:Uncharacterized protein n=2 Tax=Actinokineospora alba TaxID=504798 RepID=A0A1H0T7Q2_9PSEU|nr:hypothetical protein C8E96_1848 [Actinokineospora alba]SDJ22497.1 hypothetical protein SAMN05421871_11182 [Actinokineospora alba]SDP49628.1 hypothetical protein SAMN05192558_109293 [Actinokineospora alba]